MARRRRPEKREVLPDPRFGDVVLTKFMNSVMYEGKKSVAESIVYGALDTIESKLKREPLGVFHEALNNVRPGI
ncbi:MAG: 30S ribosomal protein S7, partial [Sphingomonadaceae bacterium]